MSAQVKSLSPWENRWTAPTLDLLLEPVDENRRRQIQTLIDRISEYPGISHQLVWLGTSWRWTLQMNLRVGSEDRPFAFIVPSPEAPAICFPIPDKVLEALPTRRLNRYIRDGLRSAKCAVDIHWAKWTPSAGTEVEHLMDLVKRLHRIYLPKEKSAA